MFACFVALLVVLNITLAHTVADVFCQPRAWALAKHDDWVALGKHVSFYTLLCILFTLPVTAVPILSLPVLALYWLLNGLSHFVIDAITSRGNWKAWQKGNDASFDKDTQARYRFHAIAWICVDQIAHMFFLLAVPLIMAILL